MSINNSVPGYRRHKQSGQAVVTLSDGFGCRKDMLLGKHGTKNSKLEYLRVVGEWEANGRRLPQADAAKDLTVNELLIAFLQHAKEYYRRPDGALSKEYEDYTFSVRPLAHFYGYTAAAAFGPLALEAVRKRMIDGYEHAKFGAQATLCRGVINQRIGRIRRVFKWGVRKELIPPSVLQALNAVEGLSAGRSRARETEAVRPVAPAMVEATLPHLLPTVSAMVQLQLLTGMRPGELVVMRGIDIDMTGRCWSYTPGSDRGPHGEHKTAWRGHKRIVTIGPRAQEILRPWLKLDTHAYLFSPAEAVGAWRLELRQRRKTKVQPSQVSRRKRRPKKSPGDRYDVHCYRRAIARACTMAFPPPGSLARRHDETKAQWEARLCPEQKESLQEWRRQHSWHPHQLRHTKATEIRREAGLDAARAVLGHRSPRITETYAEIDVTKASEVMVRLG